MRNATAIVHMARAGGAAFTQYTAEFAADGMLAPAEDQRFIYVLDGEVAVDGHLLGAGGFAYVPAGARIDVNTAAASRAAVIEKPFQALAGTTAPALFVGKEAGVTATHLADDPGLEVRALIPDDAAFDFRVNTMTFVPGAALPMVEMHVMEHGLLMLNGGGIYRLSDCWYPVDTGDFIWMAPFCPQWFGAIGKTPAKYLIYKDWDRHPR